jgi:hypothetical protein
MKESHTSKIDVDFGVMKTVENLQRNVYWPKMQEKVAIFVRGCVL